MVTGCHNGSMAGQKWYDTLCRMQTQACSSPILMGMSLSLIPMWTTEQISTELVKVYKCKLNEWHEQYTNLDQISLKPIHLCRKFLGIMSKYAINSNIYAIFGQKSMGYGISVVYSVTVSYPQTVVEGDNCKTRSDTSRLRYNTGKQQNYTTSLA